MLEILNSLTSVVWMDINREWNLTQGTSRIKLMDFILNERRALEYELFNEGEYSKALDFKRAKDREVNTPVR